MNDWQIKVFLGTDSEAAWEAWRTDYGSDIVCATAANRFFGLPLTPKGDPNAAEDDNGYLVSRALIRVAAEKREGWLQCRMDGNYRFFAYNDNGEEVADYSTYYRLRDFIRDSVGEDVTFWATMELVEPEEPEIDDPVTQFAGDYLVSLGPNPACKECFEESGLDSPLAFVDGCKDGTVDGRTEFTNAACDCCDTCLAGERFTVHLDEDHYSDVCRDCYERLASDQ